MCAPFLKWVNDRQTDGPPPGKNDSSFIKHWLKHLPSSNKHLSSMGKHLSSMYQATVNHVPSNCQSCTKWVLLLGSLGALHGFGGTGFDCCYLFKTLIHFDWISVFLCEPLMLWRKKTHDYCQQFHRHANWLMYKLQSRWPEANFADNQIVLSHNNYWTIH